MTTREITEKLNSIAADVTTLMKGQKTNPAVYEEIKRTYAKALAIVRGTPYAADRPKLGLDERAAAGRILEFIKISSDNAQVHSLEEDYAREYSGQSLDIDKVSRQTIQSAIDALRNGISSADDLAEEHKLRLLNRLEILQSELHKELPDLQRMLGTIVEISAVIKIVGENLNSFVKPIKTICKIVTGLIFFTHGLPPALSFLALPASLEDEDSDD